MNPSGNIIDLDTGDICSNEIFVVIYNSAADCFVLVAPTRLREFPVNSYYLAQTNPQTLLNYGTWSYGGPPELGLFHFDYDFSHYAYEGFYNYLFIQGGALTGPPKFGTASLSLPAGTYNNIYTPPYAKLQRGLQIDMWIAVSNSTVNAYIWGNDGCINWRLISSRLRLYDKTTLLLETNPLSYNVWYHTAIAYWWDSKGRYIGMWLHGGWVGTVVLNSASAILGTSNQILTRIDSDSNSYLIIDELRIIDSAPTYSITGYAVPTAPYTPSGPLPNLWIRTA